MLVGIKKNNNAIILEETQKLLETSDDDAILFSKHHLKLKLFKKTFSLPIIAILESTAQQERSLTFENIYKGLH